ncbi:beclin 1-associated autophagy-related key regulator-like [Panonychus citri]|uniref:beclin 1-associated autophagy-related key regulator-like n=1 Tax=Panonychus citri TaxID=50023 RepID=UPI0023078D8D|nr:beclin 1-associated autophagy-related key regulator-like [Panonychus citri]
MSLTGKLRCLICDHERENFICSTCICEGNFSSSKKQEVTKSETKRSSKHGGKASSSSSITTATPILTKFSELKTRLRLLEEEYKTINDQFEALLADNKRKESLEQAIIEHNLKNISIRRLISLTRNQLAIVDECSRKTEQMLNSSERNHDRSADDIETLRRAIVRVQYKLEKVNAEFERVRTEVEEETKTKLLQLKERIFPFYCEKVCLNSTATNSVDETFSSKEGSLFISESETDSFSTTCCPPSMGSWANVESNCQRYYIVEPWIPKCSVAQQYINWINQTQEACKLSPIGEPDGDDQYIVKNDAYRISAALSYITQLLELSSFVTDVSFPKRLNFVEFHSKFNEGTEIFLTEDEILHKVAKLNINLIHLCLSQKVDCKLLVPTHTGQNLSFLFDPNYATYNRAGPVFADTESHYRFEEALYHDYSLIESNETDYPYSDDFWDEGDWESITSAQAVAPYAELYASQQSTTSITSGIMSSALYAVTSLIRKK